MERHLSDQSLEGPALPPRSGGKPKNAVVLLHGLGDSGDGLIPIGGHWANDLPDTFFVAPHAPHPYQYMPSGRQWFNLQDWSPLSVLGGVQSAAPALNDFLDRLMRDMDLKPAQVAVMGFSQGCMMTLYACPRREKALAGLLGYSGALIGGETLAFEARSRPPVLLCHGQMDDVVPFAAMPAAAMALQLCGFAVETVTRPLMGHSIDDQSLSAGLAFIQRHFGSATSVKSQAGVG